MDQQTQDPQLLNILVLERVDRTKNMARYYVLSVEPTLFAESSLVRQWGRIGRVGRTRIDLYASPPLAQIALNTWLEKKQRRGYQLRA
jgi:predicted DNA-binding WGR domain protein